MNPEFRHLEAPAPDVRVGTRGGTFRDHVIAHLWAMLLFVLGLCCGASTAVRCR